MPVLWTARFQGAGFSFGPPEFWKAGLFAWTARWMVRKRRAKSAATAESLTKQIEEPKASNEAEPIGFELRPAGVRSVAATKALLGEHGGDVAKLKAAEPWLFADSAGGATRLEPAGVAKAADADMKR